jgi:hypothetical protein
VRIAGLNWPRERKKVGKRGKRKINENEGRKKGGGGEGRKERKEGKEDRRKGRDKDVYKHVG